MSKQIQVAQRETQLKQSGTLGEKLEFFLKSFSSLDGHPTFHSY